jgi:hypothetical protein
MFGPSIPEELALEVLATIEELTNCQVEGLRLSAFEALKACAPSIPPAERARVSMIIVRAAASADAQTGRAALNALEPYIDAIPPTSRAEAIVLLLDGRGLQIRWSTRERIAALYALRDAIPDERRATLNAAIGNWKSGDKPPRYGP